MFNWFRRQIGKSTENQDTSPTTEPQPSQISSTEPEPSEQTATDTTSEDYLQWAKTAYQKIQQRQKTETVEPESMTVVEETITEAEPDIVAPEATITEAEPDIVAPEATITEAEPDIVAPDETITEAEPNIVAPDETITPVETQTTPAWMQKSDRLEALKETAFETPTDEKEANKLELDEDFVWSAKVLAAQGRTPDDVSAEEFTWLKRLRQGLGKTRRSLINQLKSIVGQGPLNQEAVMEIEALLLQADVGIEATDYIVTALQNKLREEALPPEQAIDYLKAIIRDILDRPFQSFDNTAFVPEKDSLNIWLLTGVNGAGKTTTIGKLAHMSQQSGYRCLIAAADTFRAAAVEQVKIWGERSNTPVIANPGKNTDPAAVVYDGIAAAQARNIELLLVDTAGRLQNKKNLMDELAKIRRIIDKKAKGAKVESLLVLDATLGQNGLRQAQVFSESAKLSGVVLTKLDGSAKGGVAIAVAQQLNLPIRFIGAGEGIDDLRPFSSYEFVEALLSG